MRNCAEIYHATNVFYVVLTLWQSASQIYEIGNCAIFLSTIYTKARLSQGLLSDSMEIQYLPEATTLCVKFY